MGFELAAVNSAARGHGVTATAVRPSQGLVAQGVQVHFDGVRAVDGADLNLQEGEIVGLIGPNGAGKTTLVNAITGFERVTAGRAFLDDVDITRWSPQRRATSGLSRTFQSVRVFPRMTVFENVFATALCVTRKRREAAATSIELIEKFGLAHRSKTLAGSLPHGDERRLSIARALATSPRYICLDEPAAGLNEAESDRLASLLLSIRDEYGCGLLIIEHNMRLIMGVCDRVYVLDYGQVIASGAPAEVQANQDVRAAYLGTEPEANDA